MARSGERQRFADAGYAIFRRAHERGMDGVGNTHQVRQIVIDKCNRVQRRQRVPLGLRSRTTLPVAITRAMGNSNARRFCSRKSS